MGNGVRTGSVWNRLFAAGVLAAGLVLLTSCNLLALHRDLRAGATAGGVAGKVSMGLWQPFEFLANVDRATDGTIAVSSPLHADAVRDARDVLGFTEGHTSVLNSPAVMAAYLRILRKPGDAR